MKIEDEVREWVGDYVEKEEHVKELSAALVHVFHKHYFRVHKRKFASGLICGMLVILIILRWLH